MKFIQFVTLWVAFSCVLAFGANAEKTEILQVLQESANTSKLISASTWTSSKADNSNCFIHKVVDGKYDLIKSLHWDTGIILRSEWFEIQKKNDINTITQGVGIDLLLNIENTVLPLGREFIQCSRKNEFTDNSRKKDLTDSSFRLEMEIDSFNLNLYTLL